MLTIDRIIGSALAVSFVSCEPVFLVLSCSSERIFAKWQLVLGSWQIGWHIQPLAPLCRRRDVNTDQINQLAFVLVVEDVYPDLLSCTSNLEDNHAISRNGATYFGYVQPVYESWSKWAWSSYTIS